MTTEEIEKIARIKTLAQAVNLTSLEFKGIFWSVELDALSAGLKEEGFPCLSKAVYFGKGWIKRLANPAQVYSDMFFMRDQEEHASGPGWTWNHPDWAMDLILGQARSGSKTNAQILAESADDRL